MTSETPDSGTSRRAGVGTATAAKVLAIVAAAKVIVVVIVMVIVVVIVIAAGSLLYWVGEGRPRSPEAFRELVAARGLVVEWSNNGPRGGDGVVVTDCGEAQVSVDELDGELWVQWGDRRAPVSASVIDEIERCNPE